MSMSILVSVLVSMSQCLSNNKKLPETILSDSLANTKHSQVKHLIGLRFNESGRAFRQLQGVQDRISTEC